MIDWIAIRDESAPFNSESAQMYLIERRLAMMEERLAALEADAPTPLVWPAIDLGELR